jgi:probable HAF family extracellular repeat protein
MAIAAALGHSLPPYEQAFHSAPCLEELMRPVIPLTRLVVALLLASTSPLWTAAQDHSHEHSRYKLIDLGTLGGPISYGSASGPGARLLNDRGEVSSFSDTALPDPFAPDGCFDTDCLLAHTFLWKNGKLIDLGGIDDAFNSLGDSINDYGWVTGFAQTGLTDPSLPFPLAHAVLWKDRKAFDLGTLPDGSVSLGISVNNAGQVVGFSDNGIPDPFAMFPTGTQTRTFLWERGQLQDIGTLGGPDTTPGPGCDNQRPGVIVGSSYTSFTPNASSGVPTANPFLWDNGTMIDLGNLGGTFNFAQCANNRGEVIGQSNLPGDQAHHAFLWRKGRMQDLGTLGGPLSEAWWINDAGDIAGSADLPTPKLHDAVVWKHGRIHDLGTVPGDPCSRAYGLNSRGQVVGTSTDCVNALHAFVWEEDGPMLDLNTLIPPGSGVQLTNAIDINDRGEILVKSFPIGTTPSDDEDLGHLVLLVPCGEKDHGDCAERDRNDDAETVTAPASAIIRPPSNAQPSHSRTTKDQANSWRSRMLRQLQPPQTEQ